MLEGAAGLAHSHMIFFYVLTLFHTRVFRLCIDLIPRQPPGVGCWRAGEQQRTFEGTEGCSIINNGGFVLQLLLCSTSSPRRGGAPEVQTDRDHGLSVGAHLQQQALPHLL